MKTTVCIQNVTYNYIFCMVGILDIYAYIQVKYIYVAYMGATCTCTLHKPHTLPVLCCILCPIIDEAS